MKLNFNLPTISKSEKKKLSKEVSKRFDWSKLNFRKVNGLTLLAALSYLHILVIIPMIFSKNSPFLWYHVKQGLVVLFFWLIFAFSFYLPYLPWVVLLFIALSTIIGEYNVFTGREKPVPILGYLIKSTSDIIFE